MKLHELDTLIRSVAPIDGVSCNGRIDFKPEATDVQRQAAEQVMRDNINLLVIEKLY